MIVNKRQLADVFGVAEETITQWQKRGMPIQAQRKGTRGNEYDTAACIRWWATKDAAGGEGAPDFNAERGRLARSQADKTELEVAELKGELIRYEEVSAHWTSKAAAFRARMLSLPTKVAPQVRVAPSDPEAAALIEAEVVEALHEISGDGIPDGARTRRQRSTQGA